MGVKGEVRDKDKWEKGVRAKSGWVVVEGRVKGGLSWGRVSC